MLPGGIHHTHAVTNANSDKHQRNLALGGSADCGRVLGPFHRPSRFRLDGFISPPGAECFKASPLLVHRLDRNAFLLAVSKREYHNIGLRGLRDELPDRHLLAVE
jgi:hypothetical protein